MISEREFLSLGPLIAARARGFASRAPTSVDDRDLQQDAWLACLKAQGRYTPRRESFQTFNYLRIPGAMIDGLRRWDNRRRARRYHESLTPRITAHLPDPAPLPDRALLHREIRAALHRLEPTRAWVLIRVYFDGVTQKQVSIELGLSTSRVMQLHADGLSQLRTRLR